VTEGRLLQVNRSPGGVPKLPVAGPVRVGFSGVEGDAQAEFTVHGGRRRAVCLFAIEAIRRVAGEGHPIGPGSCGENLTTEGIELATLPPGTRLAVGDQVLLEITRPVSPCRTIAGSFRDGSFQRIDIRRHPLDARVYARVLREGWVQAGDRIQVLDPDPASSAALHLFLDQLEAAERSADVALWRAARQAGWEVDLLEDGKIAAARTPHHRGPAVNRVDGLRDFAHLVPWILERLGPGRERLWLPSQEPPWPGARPLGREVIFARPLGEEGHLPTGASTEGDRGAWPAPASAKAWAWPAAASAHPPTTGATAEDAPGPSPTSAPALRRPPTRATAEDAPGNSALGLPPDLLRRFRPAVGTRTGQHVVALEGDGQRGLAWLSFRDTVAYVAALAPDDHSELGQLLHRVAAAARERGAEALAVRVSLVGPNHQDLEATWAARLAPAGLRPLWHRLLYCWEPEASAAPGERGSF
jgi:MOSC domain-containing protein YiiM